MRLALTLSLLAAPASAQDAPNFKAGDVARGATPGVVALIVSQNPRHLAVASGDPPPLKLGAYPSAGQPGDPRLDLADPANAGDYTLGTGVVLDARAGLVLTTYGLIEGARKIYGRSSTGVGSYADIHAADARAGLAVLRLLDPPAGLASLPVRRGRTTPGVGGERPDIVAGTAVTVLGHPAPANAADGRPVVAPGTLTEVRNRWPGPTRDPLSDWKAAPLGEFAVLVRCDARATFACPGAAVLDADGELVALGSPALAVSGPDAGGFAVPLDVNFRRIVDVLRAGREVEYGFLGVTFDRMGDRMGVGLTVAGVTPGGPADRASLAGGRGALGDTITAVDGAPLRAIADLYLSVGTALAGSQVVLDVVSPGGERKRVRATLGKFPHPLAKLASVGPPAAFGVEADYASTISINQSLAIIPPGVAAGFAPDSPAGKKFAALLPAGQEPARAWVVTAVDGREVATPADFARLTAGKKSAVFTVADAARPFDTYQLTLP